MDLVSLRLVKCFQLVFPDLSDSDALAATQATLSGWDSIAAITLVNVIEDEFAIEMDLDAIADLNSFTAIRQHLVQHAGVS